LSTAKSHASCAVYQQTILMHVWIYRTVHTKDGDDVWNSVKDKMQAAMLLLGHVFPLEKVLQGHQLAAFVTTTHRTLHAELQMKEQQQVSDQTSTGKALGATHGKRAARCVGCQKHPCTVRLWCIANTVLFACLACT